jgi:ferredoxin
MSVHIEEDDCIGCSTCEEICPEVFRLNTDTKRLRSFCRKEGLKT